MVFDEPDNFKHRIQWVLMRGIIAGKPAWDQD